MPGGTRFPPRRRRNRTVGNYVREVPEEVLPSASEHIRINLEEVDALLSE
jgi:hypothetical protein